MSAVLLIFLGSVPPAQGGPSARAGRWVRHVLE